MSCFSVGSVCHTSSFEVAVFQRVCESSFIVQVFAGVTASGTSSSFLSQPLWAFILKTLPSLSSWAAGGGSWKAASVSCAFLSHFSFNTLIFQPHFFAAGVILVVCLLNFSFSFPNWLILIILVKYHVSFSPEGRGQQNYTCYYEQWMKSQHWSGIFTSWLVTWEDIRLVCALQLSVFG